jgi:hypothetical protein
VILKVVRARYVAEVLLRPGVANSKPVAGEATSLLPSLGLLVEHLNRYVLEHPAEAFRVPAVSPTTTKELDNEETHPHVATRPLEGRRHRQPCRPKEPTYRRGQTQGQWARHWPQRRQISSQRSRAPE